MDGPARKSTQTWLPLIRQARAQGQGQGDAIGSALVRLAKLAAAAHQVQADLDAEPGSASAGPLDVTHVTAAGGQLDDVRERQGRGSRSVVSRSSAPFRREVER
ncbi:MAG: hypothetical protein WD118_05425 [Phycisphaeraceae bacterium]